MAGPLQGVRIVEIAGIGPGPFCGMMLADHGAEVIRVERPGGPRSGITKNAATDVLARSRKSIVVDMKQADGVAIVRDLAKTADGFIEGFRPGVMERLGLGPEVLLADNPKLVYGRMTGYGQDGPWAQVAGHDINYIALAGALYAFSRAGEKPLAPLNMVGDFGGGGMMLAFGMVSAILHARGGGQGQVVDCAMTEGAAVLMGMVRGLLAAGQWRDEPGVNLLDGAAHFYDTYETRDGKFVAIGAIEPQFYALLRRHVGVEDDASFDAQLDPAAWPVLKRRLTEIFKTKTRDEWCGLLEGTDACFAPVLTLEESIHHPHNKARGAFVEVDGVVQPAPAPRFSSTRTDMPVMMRDVGRDAAEVLRTAGYGEERIAALRTSGVVG